mgnify:CR=1 FL=1
MTRFVRFAKTPDTPVTAPDAHPGVGHGVFEQDGIVLDYAEDRSQPGESAHPCFTSPHADILRELGYTDEEIDQFYEKGVLKAGEGCH